MEYGTIIWIAIIVFLTLATLGTYIGVHAGANYIDKDKKLTEFWVMMIGSVVTLAISGVMYGLVGSPIGAAVAMAISLVCDYILAFLMGDSEIDGTTWRLALARYLPFTTKTILLSYLSYAAGSYSYEKSAYKAFGSDAAGFSKLEEMRQKRSGVGPRRGYTRNEETGTVSKQSRGDFFAQRRDALRSSK
jgi:hypothetical protein